jgi:hypothetical protein
LRAPPFLFLIVFHTHETFLLFLKKIDAKISCETSTKQDLFFVSDCTYDPLGADAQRCFHQHRQSHVAQDHHHVRHLWLCILLLRDKVSGKAASWIS